MATLKGTHTETTGTASDTNAVTASGMRWFTISTSLRESRPADLSAWCTRLCAVVPRVVAIFLPFRSAMVLMPAFGFTQIWPVAHSMSLTRKTLPWPRAGKLESTPPVVSTSMLPPTMAWNSSTPVLNSRSSTSRFSFFQVPRCWASHMCASTLSTRR